MKNIDKWMKEGLTLSERIASYEKVNPSHKAKYINDPHRSVEEILHAEREVYVIKSASGLTKIGFSKNPKRRLTQIKLSGYFSEIILLFSPEPNYDLDARYLEKILHKHFKNKRKFGEWFDLRLDDIKEMIKSMDNMLYSSDDDYEEKYKGE